jgi:5-methylthioadenosine/S-adenosylhomocysteine deaminase
MNTLPENDLHSVLIKGGVIVTVNATDDIIEEGFILIDGDHIVSVGERVDVPPEDSVGKVIDARGSVVMPGLVNTHTHAAMACLRGLADDLPLKTWLEQCVFPAESRFVSPDFVYHGTVLAGLEMIRSGTTCFCDGYFFEKAAAAAVTDVGLRALLGQGILDFPSPDVNDPSKNMVHAKQYLESFPVTSRITPALFCHAAYTCEPETLKKARDLCCHQRVPLFIHVAETETEVGEVTSKYGRPPLTHLNELGILGHDTIVVHCVWTRPEEFSEIDKAKVRVAHCPESNMKLASGIAPVPDFLERGVTVGLGTDGCASNNNLDLFSEMDTAAKLHKVARKDPAIMDARTVVRMATIEGARVLGLEDEIGSLEPGKKADLIILDWNQAHLTPTYNYYSHLVYSATGRDVIAVMVDGKMVMEDRKILTVNEKDALSAVEEIGEEVGRYTGSDIQC